jgi:hypothetical protein
VNPLVVSLEDKDCSVKIVFVKSDDDSVLTNDVVVSTRESFGVDDAMSFDDEVGVFEELDAV